MTAITKEYIEAQIAAITKQRADAVNLILQADGALLVYNDVLAKIETPDIAAPVGGAVMDIGTPPVTPAEERPIEAPEETPDAILYGTEGEVLPGVVTE